MSAQHSSLLISLSIACYRTLLIAYPAQHRRAYGPLMQQVFRDQCHAACAQGHMSGLLRLWLRTLPDIASTAIMEHLSVDLFMDTPDQPISPVSWPHALLALLPGTLYVTMTFYATLTLTSAAITYRDPLILGLCLLLVMLGLWRNRRAQPHFPSWAYMPAGVGICCLLQMALATPVSLFGCALILLLCIRAAIVQRHALHRLLPAWRMLGLLAVAIVMSALAIAAQTSDLLSALSIAPMAVYWVVLYILMLLPALLLLPVAKEGGVMPALGFVGLLYQVIMIFMEPDYALGIWIKNQTVVAGLDALTALLLLVLAPALVLRARSTHRQVYHLLLATGLGLLAAVCIPFIKAFYSADYAWSVGSVLLRVSMGLGFFAVMGFAILAFHGMAIVAPLDKV
jgi:hypothetical protein